MGHLRCIQRIRDTSGSNERGEERLEPLVTQLYTVETFKADRFLVLERARSNAEKKATADH